LIAGDVVGEVELEASEALLLDAEHHDGGGRLGGGSEGAVEVALDLDTRREAQGIGGE
jgi:hypothetical protein